MLQLIAKLAYMFVLIAQAIVSLRFVLKLVDANSKNTFSKWIFENSDKIIEPFRGLVQQYYEIAGFKIELTSLVAIVCLGIIAYSISQMVKIFSI